MKADLLREDDMSADEDVEAATSRMVETLKAMFDSEIADREEVADKPLDELTHLHRDQIEDICLVSLEMIKSLLERWADIECRRATGEPATQLEKAQWGMARVREQAGGVAAGPELDLWPPTG
jgi:hypothetical protein